MHKRRIKYKFFISQWFRLCKFPVFSFLIMAMAIFISSVSANAQLRELEVTPEDSPESIPVFRNHPDEAAVIILSSLTDLQIESNMGVVADQSRPEDGRYILLLGANRQILTLRAPDYQETRIRVPDVSAREVLYYRVEPKDPDPVDGEGTLVLRSIPDGAQISVAGIPDFDQQTPYTFADWGAQSYRIRLEKERYESKEIVVTIEEGRAISRTLELTPDYGYLTIDEEATLRVQYYGEGSLSRLSYNPGELIELPVGQHTFRLERDNYEQEEESLVISPGEIRSWQTSLTPLYGYIVVNEPGDLRVRYDGEGSLSRLEHSPGQRLELPTGSHELELRRSYYETETGGQEISPGATTRWQPESRPLYGRLFIQTNTDAEVEVVDNFAPDTPAGVDYTYVESGRKQVMVSAADYLTEEFTIDMPAGGRLDTNLTLVSVADAEDLERRRDQPRGVIMASADIAGAEIWVNGEMVGRGSADATVLTGTHEVEFRHETGTRTKSVYVPPAQVEQVFTEMRPSRGNAIALSTLLPGGGHLYTDRSRGYLYGAAFLGAAAGTYLMWQRYDTRNSDYDTALGDYETALRNYQQAGSMEAAARYRDEIDGLFHDRIPRLHDDRSQAFDQFRYTAIGLAAIYTINLVDILVSRPQYGYRTGRPPEGFSVSAVPAGGGTVSASLTWRVSF